MVRRYTNDEIQEILRSRPPTFTPDDGITPGLPGSVPAPGIGDALTQKVLSAAGSWITPGESSSGNLNAYTLKTESSALSAGLQLNKAAVTTVAAISAGLHLTKTSVTTVAAISAGLSTRIDGKISTGLGFPGIWNRVVVSSDGIVTSGSNVGGGSGVSNFTSLTDVPSSYVGYTGRSLIVNTAQTALEYYTPMDLNNVKDFGAIGDDTTRLLTSDQAAAYNARYGSVGLSVSAGDENDWAAIQAAMLKSAWDGKQIYVPVGTYRVNKPLTLSWTATPASSAIGYPQVSRMIGAGYTSKIRSYNIPAGRASIEFLGESNPISVNMELANMTVHQETSCSSGSYCLRVGDAWCGFKGYRLNLEGAQALALKVASSFSYANLCTNFEQCRFWSNYGYAWFPNDDNAAVFCVNNESGGAFWDNVKFTSCLFNGLVQPRAFILDFDNCQFYVNPKRPLANGYDYAINCYLYLGSAFFRGCYFEDHKIAISASSFTTDVRKIHAVDCHFSGVTNFASGAPFVESAIRVFPSVNGKVGTVILEGCSFGDDYYNNGSIDIGGCTLIERGSYNITQPGKPITRNVPFTQGEWDDQDYNDNGLCSNRTSNYFIDRFNTINVTSNGTNSIHTSGGVYADLSVYSPNIVASRYKLNGVENGNLPVTVWGCGVNNAAGNDQGLLFWSSTAYTTGGIIPWVENDNLHLYIPGGKRLRIGHGINPNYYTDISIAGITMPLGEMACPYHTVSRNGDGTGNGSLWYMGVQDSAGSNQLLLGNTGTTYSTGGFLTWIGNDQPFINTSFTKGLKLGFATYPIPYHFNYNRLDTPGDIFAAGGVSAAGGLIVTGTSSFNGTITSNNTITASGGFYSYVNANYFNQLVLNNTNTGAGAASHAAIESDTSSLNLASFSSNYPVPSQSWIYTSTSTPLIFGTDGTSRMSLNTGTGALLINRHYSQDNFVDKLQVNGSAVFTGQVYADNLKYGAFNPEGNISGNVGDIFQRTNGTGGAAVYIKENGAGTTGWNPIVSNGVVALTDAVTIATDASLGSVYTVTISGNRTMGNPTNAVAGKRITYQIRQDAVGGRTINWDTNFRFSQDVPSPTLSTSANLTDYIGFMYNAISSKWDCLAISIGY